MTKMYKAMPKSFSRHFPFISLPSRSLSMSFLRRGAGTAAPGSAKKSPALEKRPWNVWSVEHEDQLRWNPGGGLSRPHSDRDLLRSQSVSTAPDSPRRMIDSNFQSSNFGGDQRLRQKVMERQHSVSVTSSPVLNSRFRDFRLESSEKSLHRKAQSLSRIEVPQFLTPPARRQNSLAMNNRHF